MRFEQTSILMSVMSAYNTGQHSPSFNNLSMIWNSIIFTTILQFLLSRKNLKVQLCNIQNYFISFLIKTINIHHNFHLYSKYCSIVTRYFTEFYSLIDTDIALTQYSKIFFQFRLTYFVFMQKKTCLESNKLWAQFNTFPYYTT